MKNPALLVREVTSRVPRIRGIGRLLAVIAKYFRRTLSQDMEVTVFGQRMLLNPADYIGNILIFTPQWYDYKERLYLEKILEKGDYVVDVGANVGVYTLMFSRLVGNSGFVTAIEAEERNAARLTHNIALNAIDFVKIHNVGVSDKDEQLDLALNAQGNGGGHSFLSQALSAKSARQSVRCVPLARLIEKNRKPKLFKLDIEGFEWRVLRKFFEDAQAGEWPTYILVEDEPRHREQDAVVLLRNFGYQVTARYDNNVFLVRGSPNAT